MKLSMLIPFSILLVTSTVILVKTGTLDKFINPPNPVVVSSNVNSESTRLFEYSAKVEAVIRNDGGDGDIVVEATVFQEGHSWTKSMKRNFTAKETADIDFTFDEVKFLDGDIKSQLRVYAY